MYVAGIDCGTQSTKVVIYEPESRTIVASAQAGHQLIVRDDGSREQRAEWWIEALEQCFSEISPSIRQAVAAIGISGQQHGLVPLSETDQVLANVKLWNDTSTTAECDEIHQRLGGASEAIRLAGNPVLPGYTASKVRWLRSRRPEIYSELVMILLPHDYLNLFLTGRRAMEPGDASGTGFLDVRSRAWSREVLWAIDDERELETCLPPLVESGQAVGRLTGRAAELLGLPPKAIVSSGGGDNMMGAIGTGAVRRGVLTLSLGTSGTLYAYSDRPVVSEHGELAAFCSSSGGWLPLVCTMSCTSSTELVRSLLGIELEGFDSLIAAAEPGAGGIRAYPFFDGERTPNLPDSRATFTGMSTSNLCKENLLRAVVEATALGLRAGLGAMTRAGAEADEVRAVGGGANSDQWLQIVADVFQRRVRVPTSHEASAFGAALQALWCHSCERGRPCSIEEITDRHVQLDESRAFEPRPERAAQYEDLFEEYMSKLDVISGLERRAGVAG